MIKPLYLTFVFLSFALFLASCNVLINPTGEIVVMQDTTEYESGISEYDFGYVLIGNPSDEVTFTIANLGKSKLFLSDDPSPISISDENDFFTVDQSMIIRVLKVGDSTDFTVSFTPGTVGESSATISIYSSDVDENPFTFTVKGEGVVPEIIVKQGSDEIPYKTGVYDFGEVFVGESSQDIEFTIENIGNGLLLLTGTPDVVALTGADASMFTVTQTPANLNLNPGVTTTFKVSFSPTSILSKTATISFENSVDGQNPYTFTVIGEGISPPEINVKQDTTDIPSGTGTYDFGEVVVEETSGEVEFTIENLGTEDLELTGAPEFVSISGADKAMFSVDVSDLIIPVLFEQTTIFKITFTPTSRGSKTAVVSIANNDSDEDPYTFTITGSGLAAEIDIENSNSVSIPNGTGEFDFGSQLVNTSTTENFTVKNLGNYSLFLNGTPIVEISGTGMSAFTVKEMPDSEIAGGSDSIFIIEFIPTDRINYTATVSIANSDSDEDPYTFTIKGEGLSPEINVQDSQPVDIPSGTGTFDFGSHMVNTTTSETFTVQNLGNYNLTLSGSPIVEIYGPGASAFTVTAMPANEIAPGSDSTFTIEFTPTDKVNYSATVSIINNDTDENPYTFTIIGAGLVDDQTFDFNGDGYDDIIIGAPGDDEIGTGAGCAYIYFGAASSASKLATSDADVKILAENAEDGFGYNVSAIDDFNNDGFDDVLITARLNSEGGNYAGAAYIFFGSLHPASKIYASNADVKIVGEYANDNFGAFCAAIGDFNRDGFQDVIVTSLHNDRGGEDAGTAYIFFGSSSPSSKIQASNADVKLIGEDAGDGLGWFVSRAGDFNNDGIDDVLIGANGDDDGGTNAGCVYVFFGSTTPPSTIYASNANVKIVCDNCTSLTACSYAGDFNNDSIDDIMLSCRLTTRLTVVCIYYGRRNPPSPMNRSNANVVISGRHSDETIGSCMNYVGDINNDHIDDIVIADPNYSEGSNKLGLGCAYVYYGSNSPQSSMDPSDADVKIIGNETGDNLASGISSLGDFNNDGIRDFVVSTHKVDDNMLWDSGSAFIFYGKSNLSSYMYAGNADVWILGDYRSQLGRSVSGGQ